MLPRSSPLFGHIEVYSVFLNTEERIIFVSRLKWRREGQWTWSSTRMLWPILPQPWQPQWWILYSNSITWKFFWTYTGELKTRYMLGFVKTIRKIRFTEERETVMWSPLGNKASWSGMHKTWIGSNQIADLHPILGIKKKFLFSEIRVASIQVLFLPIPNLRGDRHLFCITSTSTPTLWGSCKGKHAPITARHKIKTWHLRKYLSPPMFCISLYLVTNNGFLHIIMNQLCLKLLTILINCHVISWTHCHKIQTDFNNAA